jgi:hypothetical protein
VRFASRKIKPGESTINASIEDAGMTHYSESMIEEGYFKGFEPKKHR